MCYAIPGKVESVEQKIVMVNYFGERKKAVNELPDILPGDYVYAQGGFVIEKIPEREAEDILAVWKESFFELQELDLRLSGTEDGAGMKKGMKLILDRVLEERPVSNEDYVSLLDAQEETEFQTLFKTANFLRQKYHGNSCCVHGIIEISNYCSSDCAYCGIACSNRSLERYRMTPKEIVETAVQAVTEFGFKALVLQSGEDPGYSIKELADLIREIRSKVPVLIFISFGEMGPEDLKKLYDAGARGLLMRFETSNPELYGKIHCGETLDSRIEVIRNASALGYFLITGALIGLPGQTRSDIVNDVLLAKSLGSQMFSFGPFLPHPATPLSGENAPTEADILKTLALCRFIDPKNANVVVTTALETIDLEARRKALLAGANSVMMNLTPLKYRKLYSIYPRRAHDEEAIENPISDTVNLLHSIGRAPTDLGIS